MDIGDRVYLVNRRQNLQALLSKWLQPSTMYLLVSYTLLQTAIIEQ